MKKVALKVARRETGKKAAKDYRNSGMVPGVFYQAGKENYSLLASPADLKQLVYTNEAKIVELEIEGVSGTKTCFVKEMKFHPVTDKLIHFDLLGLVDDKKTTFVLPISLTGSSSGVKEGGVLQQNLYRMKVKCLPKDLVPSLVVDVTNLAVGKVIQVGDLKSDTLEFVLPASTTVVQVTKSRTSKA